MDEAAAHRWLRAFLRSEMVKRHVGYAELLERLAAIGVEDTENNVRNKVARGKFSALFLMQCAEALGIKSIPVEILKDQGLEHLRPSRNISQAKYSATEPMVEMIIEEIDNSENDGE